MTETEAGVPRGRWKRRVGWTFLSLIVLLFIVHALWSAESRGRLDKLVAAYRAAGEPVKIDDWIEPPIPDDQNAAVEVQAALAAVHPQSNADETVGHMQGFVLPFLGGERAAVAAFLTEKAAALPLMDAAMEKPQFVWPEVPWGGRPAIDAMLPGLSDWRVLANTLELSALDACARGDQVTALLRVREMLFLGACLDRRRPSLMTFLVAAGIRAAA